MTQISPDKVIESLGRSILADGFDMVLDVKKSKGARLYDSKNKRTLLDFFSFFASNPLGMNHPKLHDKAFEAKLLEYARVKVANSDIYTTAYAEFVEIFHKNVAPMFDKLFFIEGGALGVENALKVAQDWKVQKNIRAGRGEKGTQILHFREAFHGRTGYTLSLTNTSPEKTNYFPKFDWPRVTTPKMSFPITAASLQKTQALEEKSIQEIKEAFESRPHEICAIILEPIQGEGGDNMFRKEFFQKLRELADNYDALLIFDEVQTGLGLTGKFWAFEHFGVEPDLIAFGKKVQVCGCAARTQRLQEVDNVFKVSSRINSTWGGNLTDMVRTTRFIEIILEDRLLDNVNKVGTYLKAELEKLSHKFDYMTNIRGLGLWLAFDLPVTEARNKFIDLAWENGLVILPCGKQSVRVRPILDLSESEAQEGLDIISKTIEQIGNTQGKSGAAAWRQQSI